MALDPLATVDDITARYAGTMTDDNSARLPAMLTDASATVRNFTRQTFTQATTTERIRPIGDRVRLPQRPVTSVTSCALVDTLESGQVIPLPLSAWMWDGGQEIWLGAVNSIVNVPDEVTQLLQFQVPLMEVTYSHGYAAVPDDIVAVVCSMVIRTIDVPGPVGMQYQTVGPYGYRLSATAQEGIMSLTPAEQRVLAPYRRQGTTTELR